MTAWELIADIYARPQAGMASNERRITARQLGYLKDLIAEDEEGGAIEKRGPGVWLWLPSGRTKYEITEDFVKGRHKIARLANVSASATGRLF
jgi:threonyl-tRNA synthetase